MRYDDEPMSKPEKGPRGRRPSGPSLLGVLKPYRHVVAALVLMTLIGNSFNLVVPRLIAHAIDAYARQQLVLRTFIAQFFAVSSGVCLFSYFQLVFQTHASSRVARDLRTQLIGKISAQ